MRGRFATAPYRRVIYLSPFPCAGRRAGRRDAVKVMHSSARMGVGSCNDELSSDYE